MKYRLVIFVPASPIIKKKKHRIMSTVDIPIIFGDIAMSNANPHGTPYNIICVYRGPIVTIGISTKRRNVYFLNIGRPFTP